MYAWAKIWPTLCSLFLYDQFRPFCSLSYVQLRDYRYSEMAERFQEWEYHSIGAKVTKFNLNIVVSPRMNLNFHSRSSTLCPVESAVAYFSSLMNSICTLTMTYSNLYKLAYEKYICISCSSNLVCKFANPRVRRIPRLLQSKVVKSIY